MHIQLNCILQNWELAFLRTVLFAPPLLAPLSPYHSVDLEQNCRMYEKWFVIHLYFPEIHVMNLWYVGLKLQLMYIYLLQL